VNLLHREQKEAKKLSRYVVSGPLRQRSRRHRMDSEMSKSPAKAGPSCLLTPEQHRVLREAGTERAFSSPLNSEKRRGTFLCVGCNSPLYASKTKYDSGSGWPSFWQPLDGAVTIKTDISHGMKRTEVLCSHCGGHLGHVFEDGPPPTGLRYCMNGLAMIFKPDKD